MCTRGCSKKSRMGQISKQAYHKTYMSDSEGKAERINRQPIFSTVSCCLPSLVTCALRALHYAGHTTADRGKKWSSINSLYLTLPTLKVIIIHYVCILSYQCIFSILYKCSGIDAHFDCESEVYFVCTCHFNFVKLNKYLDTLIFKKKTLF